MATDQEIIELVLRTRGVEQAKAVADALRDVKTAGEAAGAAQAQLGKKSADLGYGMLQLSRGLEDLQYGFAGVVNNITPTVMALGGTAGIGAAVGLLAVGVNILINQWKNLGPALTGAKVETHTQEMERLEKATNRTAEQTERLNKLKKESQAIEQAKAVSAPIVQDFAKATKEALETAGGFDKVFKAIADEMEMRGPFPGTEESRKNAEDFAQKTIGKAMEGNRAAFRTMMGFAAPSFGAGPAAEGVGVAFQGADPEAREKERQFIQRQVEQRNLTRALAEKAAQQQAIDTDREAARIHSQQERRQEEIDRDKALHKGETDRAAALRAAEVARLKAGLPEPHEKALGEARGAAAAQAREKEVERLKVLQHFREHGQAEAFEPYLNMEQNAFQEVFKTQAEMQAGFSRQTLFYRQVIAAQKQLRRQLEDSMSTLLNQGDQR